MTEFQAFMGDGGWVIYTLIASVISVISYVVNQYLKQPGHLLVFWSRLMTVAAMTPFMLHFDWPDNPVFYGAVFLSLVGALADIRMFNVAARYGGGVVSRVSPLVILLVFILWFFFDPGLLKTYAEHPFNTLMILVALGGCVFFSMRLSRCHISRNAFIEMIPALIGYTISTVFNKFAMGHGSMTGVVFGYMYFQSVLAVPMVGGYVLWHERRKKHLSVFVRHRKMMLTAALTTFAWIASMIFRNYAMVFTPNPSYIAAIGQTTPVFIALFYFLVRHKEEADVASGMGVVACTALLAVMTV